MKKFFPFLFLLIIFSSIITAQTTIDDFEDNDISEYSGETSFFSLNATNTINGSYSLQGEDDGGAHEIYSTTGLTNYPSQGDDVSYWVEDVVDDGSTNSQHGFLFGVQDSNNLYLVRINSGNNAVDFFKKNSGSYTKLKSITTSNTIPSEEPFKTKIFWRNSGDIDVRLYDKSGTVLGTLNHSETTYTSGGIGFRINSGGGDTRLFDSILIEDDSSTGSGGSNNFTNSKVSDSAYLFTHENQSSSPSYDYSLQQNNGDWIGTISGGSTGVSALSNNNKSVDVDGRIDYSNISEIDADKDFTLALWTQPKSVSTGVSQIFGKFDGSKGFRIYYNNPGYGIQFNDGSTNVANSGSSNGQGLDSLIMSYDVSAGNSTLYVNGLKNVTLSGIPSFSSSASMTVGNGVGGTGDDYNGLVDEVRAYNKYLTDDERSNLRSCGYLSCDASISVGFPSDFKAYAENSTGNVGMRITGNVSGASGVEACFAGRMCQTVDSSVSSGSFNGTITEGNGQGNLVVRVSNDTSVNQTVSKISVSKAISIAGQSNAVMKGTYLQDALNGNTEPTVFNGNGTGWFDGSSDPYHPKSAVNGYPTGSSWPLIADRFESNRGKVVSYTASAVGGTSVTSWQKGDASGYYDDLISDVKSAYPYTYDNTNIFWHQGEADVGSLSESQYESELTSLINDVKYDLNNTSFFVSRIHSECCSGAQTIIDAQIDVVNNETEVFDGGNHTGITGLLHFESNQSLQSVANVRYNAFVDKNESVSLQDTTAPNLSIDSPVDGEAYNYQDTKTGVNIEFSGSVDTSFTGSLDVLVDGTSVYTESINSGSNSYSYNQEFTQGTYDTTLQVTSDNTGNTYTSNTNTFTVDEVSNPPPVINKTIYNENVSQDDSVDFNLLGSDYTNNLDSYSFQVNYNDSTVDTATGSINEQSRWINVTDLFKASKVGEYTIQASLTDNNDITTTENFKVNVEEGNVAFNLKQPNDTVETGGVNDYNTSFQYDINLPSNGIVTLYVSEPGQSDFVPDGSESLQGITYTGREIIEEFNNISYSNIAGKDYRASGTYEWYLQYESSATGNIYTSSVNSWQFIDTPETTNTTDQEEDGGLFAGLTNIIYIIGFLLSLALPFWIKIQIDG